MGRGLPTKNILLKFVLILAVFAPFAARAADNSETARWEQQARNITIIRDEWGIAHVYGTTDADAVFGMIYAQAEDDFNRVETNYINAMGRLAETEGETKIYKDLRAKLFFDPDTAKKEYAGSPEWLKKLMIAWADGLNFYLYKHPEVKPRVIRHFEPWMTLMFSEGSIGGDTERVNLAQLEAFYGNASSKQSVPTTAASLRDEFKEPSGSNGVAVAPSNTKSHHALLLINPHTSFFFRSELQMTSEQGLNAYGAVTWGQFFVYQGFNEHAGWMHTTSGADAIDEYLETVSKKGDKYYYKYGHEERPVTVSEIAIPYTAGREMAEKKFTVYRTHHGPVVRELNGKWVAFRIMHEPVKALIQSFTRTKATDYKTYLRTMDLHANSTNNTVYADADGNIAYFQANFIPKREPRFDWTQPVDGSDPATEWNGVLSVDASPHLLNPKSGWLYNSNNAPWSAAGPSSPKKEDFPPYVDNGRESARGLHAVKVLENKKDFTLDSLIAAAYDSYLTWFDQPLPALIKAWGNAPSADPLKSKLAEPVSILRSWDQRWAVGSVPTSVAVFWGEEIRRRMTGDARKSGLLLEDYAATRVPAGQLLECLAAAVDKLTADFGTWKVHWGDINRYQRLTSDIVQQFNDAAPSIPVGFTSSTWGSLASFGARAYSGTKKWYGTSGNSFVAVVEFGNQVRARAVTAGGESGHHESKHFNDEAEGYATGNLREVYYYRSQLVGHIEREYHPGS